MGEESLAKRAGQGCGFRAALGVFCPLLPVPVQHEGAKSLGQVVCPPSSLQGSRVPHVCVTDVCSVPWPQQPSVSGTDVTSDGKGVEWRRGGKAGRRWDTAGDLCPFLSCISTSPGIIACARKEFSPISVVCLASVLLAPHFQTFPLPLV